MLSICYYVSGHGFGHATRASQIIQSLLNTQSTTITICTKAPQHLFPQSPRLKYRQRDVDSIVVQPLPYEIDVEASLEALGSFVQNLRRKDGDGKTWIETELQFLDNAAPGFDVLLADAPWSIGLLNPKKKVVKILITNFTFDLIFQTLLTFHLSPSTPQTTQDKYRTYYEEVLNAYTFFDYLIRLPGFIDFPFLQQGNCKTRVTDAPLVYRPPTEKSRQGLLEELHIPAEFRHYKILLVQFGGHAISTSSSPPLLPPNWICLINASISDPRFFTFSSEIYLPDLINIADAVLGKIGYGTVSECVGMGKPLIYVRREMFAEEEYLLRYLGEQGVGGEIDQEAFEKGEWKDILERVMGRSESLGKEGRTLGCRDGSAVVGRTVEELVGKKGDGD